MLIVFCAGIVTAFLLNDIAEWHVSRVNNRGGDQK